MRRIALLLALSLYLAALGTAVSALSAQAPGQPPAPPSGQAEPAVTGYICPMHPDVIQAEPGR